MVSTRMRMEPAGLIFVDVFEGEVGRAGLGDGFLDDGVDGRVVAALEAGELERDEIGMARGVLGRPDFLAGVLAVGIFPGIADVERMGDDAGAHFFAEKALENFSVDGQRAERQHGIAELLEFLEDVVVQAGIVVIRARQQDDADAVFGFELLEDFAALLAQDAFAEVEHGGFRGLRGAVIFFGRKAEDVAEGVEHLALEQVGHAAIDERIEEFDAHFLEEIAFLGEGRLGGRGGGGDGGAGAMALRVHHVGGQIVDHGEEDDVERLLLVVHVEQVVHVRDADLRREAGIDRAALGAGLVQLLGGVVGVDQVIGGDAERLEIGAERRDCRCIG